MIIKKILLYIIIIIITIPSIFCQNTELLYNKIYILEQLNNQFQQKIQHQDNIINKQQNIIVLDSLQIDYYKKQIQLYKIQINKYKEINQIDSLQINKLKNDKNKWYDNKYLYFVYGVSIILISSIVLNNINN